MKKNIARVARRTASNRQSSRIRRRFEETRCRGEEEKRKSAKTKKEEMSRDRVDPRRRATERANRREE